MRIGLYGIVTPGPHTGVGRQLYGLLDGLQQIDPHNDYLVYDSRPPVLPVHASNFQRRPLPVSAKSRLKNHLASALLLPVLAERHGLDLLHVPNTMPLLPSPRPLAVTLYDLTEFALEQRVYTAGRHRYRRLANRLAARSASVIITTSANTKQDLVRYVGADPQKIQVIYPGIDHQHFRPQTLSAERRAHLSHTYNLPQRFLLYTGKIQPRKNLVRLLQAFHQVRPAHPDVHLVLTGGQGWMNQEVNEVIERLELAPAVHFTGYVADEDLPALYSLAEMLVFPSLYEGFGFPVVEAMACGTPVLTASTSSLGEIAADAALCVDPTSVAAIAEALDSGLRDEALRATLRQKGLARAQHFTWTRCAAETLACYRAVAGLA